LGSDGSLYLLRCWLVEPQLGTNSDETFESGNSVLLHYFPQPDEDRCLHDHPWAFTTTILAGGYDERLPSDSWRGKANGLGPAYGDYVIHGRVPGNSVERAASDLHLVARLPFGPTWTLVRTGPRVRDWGFHQPNQQWMSHVDYFAARRNDPTNAHGLAAPAVIRRENQPESHTNAH
jgi:hypothetical protein